VRDLSRVLGIREDVWREVERTALTNFAVTLSLVKDLARWNQNEKQELLKIIQAKAGKDESQYLKLMQRHARLRKAFLRLGS
jgi:hypothetical protein